MCTVVGFDSVLGSSADWTRLYLTYALDRDAQLSPESFGWIDIATPGSEPIVSFLEGGGKFADGTVSIAHADGTGKRTIQLPEGYGTFRFSPGAQRLAFTREDGIWTAGSITPWPASSSSFPASRIACLFYRSGE